MKRDWATVSHFTNRTGRCAALHFAFHGQQEGRAAQRRPLSNNQVLPREPTADQPIGPLPPWACWGSMPAAAALARQLAELTPRC
mmetsp:Transcript_116707/g.362620  ORF Transcript_116707/g.362620 Transcript_116707/m.362620 type:complete len:85 (-) Transcript_116707:1166-1420(-)